MAKPKPPTIIVRAGQYPVPIVDVIDGREVPRDRRLVEDDAIDGGFRDASMIYPGDAPLEVVDCRYYQKRIAVGDLIVSATGQEG